jgi:rod shape determining protein RodA
MQYELCIMLRRYFLAYDYALLLLTLALMLFGLAMVHSAAPNDPTQDFFGQQLMWVGVGLGAMFVATIIDYRAIGFFSRPMYIGIVVLLAMIFFLGQTNFGSQRWFEILDRNLQPSEFAKLFLILTLSKYLSGRNGSWVSIIISGVLVAIPVLLILLQPNLSTSIIIATIWLVLAVMAGMPIRWLLIVGCVVAIVAPIVWPYLPEYQRDRVTIFLDPAQDPSGQGYNLIQSRIAIGGGGLMGQGYDQGSQSQLGYLRVRHTDFIFSVIAEELGFMGSLLLFGLLIGMIFRLVSAAARVHDPFGQLIIAGVAGWIFFQSFVNIGVNVGIVPPTGVPLPFISYGGSNLLTLALAIGIVQSVVIHQQQKLEFD